MDITEIILALAIAIIYPYFFNKLIDRILGYDQINSMCDNVKYDSGDQSDYKRCNDIKDRELDKIELSRHITFLVVALASILLCSMIRQRSTKLGIGIGGIILLIIAMSIYWRKYNETYKLIILGIALAAVVYISIKLYTVGSIEDVFTLEFGTKQT